MSTTEALTGKKTAPRGVLAALFGGKKPKRHALPKWAAEKAKKG